MADFDLTQTDAQVQSILNDGQNMQGAGAQTTLTTESVLLKDVNGNYHKILKSSFTEAIRDTLAGLLVNNDKGTTINQIAAIASGDFGSITPANLASVLGDGNEIDSSTNLNQLTKAGIYWWKSSLPSNTGGSETWCYVVVKTLSNRYVIQYVYRIDSSGFLRKRNIDTQTSTIGNWVSKIDVAEDILSDSTILFGLASALGGVTINKKTSSSNPIDFDTLTTVGVNYLIGAATTNAYTNSPFSNGQCWGILTCQEAGTSGESYVTQTFNDARGQFYKRVKDGNTWGSWQRIDNFGCNTLAELKAALANV